MNIRGKRKLKIIEVAGNSYEMGFQYGAACPEIRVMLDINSEVFDTRDVVTDITGKYLGMYLPPAEAYAPEIIDEMKGIAAGAKVDFKDIFLINLIYEISASLNMGCTSFAATGETIDNGGIISGQNFDFLMMWEDIMVLLKMKPIQGPEIMAIAPAGCLGLIGLNSAGISLNLNLIRNKDSLLPAGGVPSHVILRKVLSSENIGEAISIIASAERRSAKNYLLASDQGDVVDVEVTMNDLDVHYTERGILTHANHYKTERFKKADLASVILPDSYIRSHRLARLMEENRNNLSVDTIKRLLQDHNNYPNSVCRHPDPRAALPIGKMMKTILSVINSPRERKAYIALGNPCENEYMEYQL
jgi:isopenicillin-N N-acyltransferase-like protein